MGLHPEHKGPVLPSLGSLPSLQCGTGGQDSPRFLCRRAQVGFLGPDHPLRGWQRVKAGAPNSVQLSESAFPKTEFILTSHVTFCASPYSPLQNSRVILNTVGGWGGRRQGERLSGWFEFRLEERVRPSKGRIRKETSIVQQVSLVTF